MFVTDVSFYVMSYVTRRFCLGGRRLRVSRAWLWRRIEDIPVERHAPFLSVGRRNKYTEHKSQGD
jgi:hypothetical protein